MPLVEPVAFHPSIAPDEPGHIPTVKVIALAREHCRKDDIKEWIERERQGYTAVGDDEDKTLWEAMAVEFGCRELLARYWSRLSVKERGTQGALRSISPGSFEGD